MNKNLKKLLVMVALILSISNIMPTVVYAKENDIHCIEADLEYGDIILRNPTEEEEKFINNGTIEQIAIDDIDEYIVKLKKGKIDITQSIQEKVPSISYFALSDVSSKFIAIDPIPVPPVKINCQFTYTSKKNNKGKYYFTSVSKIKSWLTGVQVPLSYTWSQKGSSKTFSKNKQAVTIKVNGVLSTYILVKGVGKILDQNMSYSFKFTARK